MAEIIPIEWFLRSPSKSKSKSKKIELVSVDKTLINTIKKNSKLIQDLKKAYNNFLKETDILKLNQTILDYTKHYDFLENKQRLTKEDKEAMSKRYEVLLNRIVLENNKKYSEIYNLLNRELALFIVENDIKKGKEVEKLALLMSQNFLDLLLYSEITGSFNKVFIGNSNEKKTKEELNEELKTLSLVEKLLKEKIVLVEKHLLVLIRRLITGGK
jgi:hypothetical protein